MNESESPAVARPTALVVLIGLTGLHALLSLVILLAGLAGGNGMALFGGSVSSACNVAILVGLIKVREWARIFLIWLCYVGIVTYGLQSMVFPRAAPILVPLLALEIVTLIFAHNRSVLQATKSASIAKTYTYHETVEQRKESE